jgi:hypothetical protein
VGAGTASNIPPQGKFTGSVILGLVTESTEYLIEHLKFKFKFFSSPPPPRGTELRKVAHRRLIMILSFYCDPSTLRSTIPRDVSPLHSLHNFHPPCVVISPLFFSILPARPRAPRSQRPSSDVTYRLRKQPCMCTLSVQELSAKFTIKK